MSQIIASQTLAIEALTLRLEAAERRLDSAIGSTSEPGLVRLKPDTTDPPVRLKPDTTDPPDTTEPLIDLFDPFRAARAVDWAQVVESLMP